MVLSLSNALAGHDEREHRGEGREAEEKHGWHPEREAHWRVIGNVGKGGDRFRVVVVRSGICASDRQMHCLTHGTCQRRVVRSQVHLSHRILSGKAFKRPGCDGRSWRANCNPSMATCTLAVSGVCATEGTRVGARTISGRRLSTATVSAMISCRRSASSVAPSIGFVTVRLAPLDFTIVCSRSINDSRRPATIAAARLTSRAPGGAAVRRSSRFRPDRGLTLRRGFSEPLDDRVVVWVRVGPRRLGLDPLGLLPGLVFVASNSLSRGLTSLLNAVPALFSCAP
jgi:hypothetical protein